MFVVIVVVVVVIHSLESSDGDVLCDTVFLPNPTCV